MKQAYVILQEIRGIYMNTEDVKTRLSKLESIKNVAEKELENAPEGSLLLYKNSRGIQFYHRRENGVRKYIRKKDVSTVSKLAQKEYDKKIIKVIDEEERLIRDFLKGYNPNSLQDIYESFPESKRKYISKYEVTDAEYADNWLATKKEKLGNVEVEEHLKELALITENGEYVRSKSEKIIADTLFKKNIAYVYEELLYLKGYGYVRPDFVVLNKTTRKEYIWEHFGLMDDQAYIHKAIKKIELYARNGYIMGKNLIVTFENKETPLNMLMINNTIKAFFDN